MARLIEFTKYFYDDAKSGENFEELRDNMLIDYDTMDKEEATECLMHLLENKPFSEIGIKFAFDVDTGEMTCLGLESEYKV